MEKGKFNQKWITTNKVTECANEMTFVLVSTFRNIKYLILYKHIFLNLSKSGKHILDIQMRKHI